MSLPKPVTYWKAPLIRSWFLVHSKNLPAATNNDQRRTNNQTGFALLPLIVLLLVGIATGTLLIQNGVNFLPKAVVTDQYFPCNDSQMDKLSSDSCPKQKAIFDHCDVVQNGQVASYSNGATRAQCLIWTNEKAAGRMAVDEVNTFCVWDPPQCSSTTQTCPNVKLKYNDNDYSFSNDSNVATGVLIPNVPLTLDNKSYTGTACMISTACQMNCAHIEPDIQSAPAIEPSKCLLRQVRIPGTDARGDISIDANSTREYCDVNDKMYSYRCEEGIVYPTAVPSKDNQCAPPSIQAAPATQPNSYKPPSITDTKCTERQLTLTKCSTNTEEAKKLCVVDHAGFASCMYSEGTADGTKCNKTNQDTCQPGENCILIDRLPRCIRNACLPAETTHCSDGGECITATKKINGTDYTYTYCGPATATAAAAGAGSPAAGSPPQPQRQASGPQPQSGGQITQAVPTECGYTRDGISIPCYKVGVFTNADDLKATIDQARIASDRYSKSQQILTAVKDKINSDIAAAAQKKLEAAKAAADACMKQ